MDIKKPLVSVLISAYNHQKYVQETIKSIIAQTYTNIELLVIDDGSQDKTWDKIQEMKDECEQRFINVILETQKNIGAGATGNRMLKIAQGEYVYMIASDDLAKPFAIEKELLFLENNKEYALAVGDNDIIDGDGRICFWDEKRNIVYNEDEVRYKTFSEFLQRNKAFKFTSPIFGSYPTLFLGNYIPNGYLIRKSIFDKTGLYIKEAPLEDWYLMLQIAKYAKMKYIGEVLFSYRWHGANTIKHEEKMKQYVQITKRYEKQKLKQLNNKNFLPEAKKAKFFISLQNNKFLSILYYFYQFAISIQRRGITQTINVCLQKISNKNFPKQ